MCIFFEDGCVYWSRRCLSDACRSLWEFLFEESTELGVFLFESLPRRFTRLALRVRWLYYWGWPRLLNTKKSLQLTVKMCECFEDKREEGLLCITNVISPGLDAKHFAEGLAYSDHRYDPTERMRASCSPFFRVLRPRLSVLDAAERFWARHVRISESVIGVHIRGTDSLVDVRRPKWTMDRYILEIQSAVSQHSASKIYLATDDSKYVTMLKEHFGSIVFSYEAVRADGSTQGGGATKGTGALMPIFLLGDEGKSLCNAMDVIVEYVSLCRCDFLVHGTSSVPAGVLLSCPTLPNVNVSGPMQW